MYTAPTPIHNRLRVPGTLPTRPHPDHHHMPSLPVSSKMTSLLFYEKENINS